MSNWYRSVTGRVTDCAGVRTKWQLKARYVMAKPVWEPAWLHYLTNRLRAGSRRPINRGRKPA